MSTLFWSVAKENPGPGLALAFLNLVVALFLVGLSLLLGVTISLLAGLHAFVSDGRLRILGLVQDRSDHRQPEPEA